MMLTRITVKIMMYDNDKNDDEDGDEQ